MHGSVGSFGCAIRDKYKHAESDVSIVALGVRAVTLPKLLLSGGICLALSIFPAGASTGPQTIKTEEDIDQRNRPGAAPDSRHSVTSAHPDEKLFRTPQFTVLYPNGWLG